MELSRALLPAAITSTAIAIVVLGAKQLLGKINLADFVAITGLILFAHGIICLFLWWKLKAGLLQNLVHTARPYAAIRTR